MILNDWRNIPQERIKEILEKSKQDKSLFNWCEEYKQFIQDCVSCCVSSEWDYMFKKAFDDPDSPIDLSGFDLYELDKEDLDYQILQDIRSLEKEDFEKFFKELNNEDIKSLDNLKNYLKNLEEKNEYDDLLINSYLNHIDIDEFNREIEVYEWWIIQDPLKYRLEQQGQIFLNGAWGRRTTGQSISLDYCCINAFLDYLKDRIH